ncbi:MAG: hypothetical protein IKD21_02035 [Clostridia bacterium]|nr:hypothetical protein [Clostridia bacterium]
MEKFISDLKQTVNGAVKKSGELIELTKIKMAAADTKNSIQDKFTKLGELTYLAAKGEDMPAADIETIVTEIDELKQTLTEQEAKAAELGGKKICPHCDKALNAEFSFCPACGNPMEDIETFVD